MIYNLIFNYKKYNKLCKNVIRIEIEFEFENKNNVFNSSNEWLQIRKIEKNFKYLNLSK